MHIIRVSKYGDEITFSAISNVYGVELKIVSSLGQNAMVDSIPDSVSRKLINIGEKSGIHYTAL